MRPVVIHGQADPIEVVGGVVRRREGARVDDHGRDIAAGRVNLVKQVDRGNTVGVRHLRGDGHGLAGGGRRWAVVDLSDGGGGVSGEVAVLPAGRGQR